MILRARCPSAPLHHRSLLSLFWLFKPSLPLAHATRSLKCSPGSLVSRLPPAPLLPDAEAALLDPFVLTPSAVGLQAQFEELVARRVARERLREKVTPCCRTKARHTQSHDSLELSHNIG